MKRRIALLAAACVAVMALGGCQKVNEAPTAPAGSQGGAELAKEEPGGRKGRGSGSSGTQGGPPPPPPPRRKPPAGRRPAAS